MQIHTIFKYIFSVSDKINLLNQLSTASSASNSQRTLDLIRQDLSSDSVMNSEGTYFDSRHPHLFVVFGASVSKIFN